jgi:hypothetical protein
VAVVLLGLAAAFGLGFVRDCSGLQGGAAMVFGEEAFEDFLAGGGADGVADAVVFGEGFDFMEVVAEVEGRSSRRRRGWRGRVGGGGGAVRGCPGSRLRLLQPSPPMSGYALNPTYLATWAGVRSRVWNRL